MHIDGHPAKLYSGPALGPSAPYSCPAVGATEQLSLTILIGTRESTWLTVMTACLNDPTDHTEQQARAMIDSIDITI